jgi:ABC-type branched-subunit amino acid transport system permease subunit
MDLGYVALRHWRISMGVLFTRAGILQQPWQAYLRPIILGLAGHLGMPVLKMRGDYLAIVTLGFGEIVDC